jgi:hypothetical protein
MEKPLNKLIQAKKTSTKLRILADKVETYENFDQSENDYCVVGYGGFLHGRDQWSNTSSAFSEDFGTSKDEAHALLLSQYGQLRIGVRSRLKMELVTREFAAGVLRKLANKYAAKGK